MTIEKKRLGTCWRCINPERKCSAVHPWRCQMENGLTRTPSHFLVFSFQSNYPHTVYRLNELIILTLPVSLDYHGSHENAIIKSVYGELTGSESFVPGLNRINRNVCLPPLRRSDDGSRYFERIRLDNGADFLYSHNHRRTGFVYGTGVLLQKSIGCQGDRS
jgi:hypothetical protein